MMVEDEQEQVIKWATEGVVKDFYLVFYNVIHTLVVMGMKVS